MNRFLVGGVAAAVAGTVFMACHESSTPPAVGSSSSTMKAQRLTQNRFAWVGEAHNQGLKELFSRPDHGRGKFGDVCTRFVVSLMTTPTVKSLRSQPDYEDGLFADAIKAGLKTGKCAAWRESFRAGKVKFRPVMNPSTTALAIPEGYAVSPAVQAQLDAITANADQATTAAHYDELIDPIVQAASGFTDSLDQAVVLASAAVASASAHFWEANYESQMSALVAASKADFSQNPNCVPEYVDGDWVVPIECVDGGSLVTSTGGTRFNAALWNPGMNSKPFRLAMMTPLPRNEQEQSCIASWEGDGSWRSVLKRDAIGAFTGAIVGAIAGKTPQATGMAAAGGGLASSAADTLWRAAVIAICEWYY
jgi:hypothetical protein